MKSSPLHYIVIITNIHMKQSIHITVCIPVTITYICLLAGADPGFQVRRGAYLKKLRRAEGGANIFGVFRVKYHDFTPKNHIFSNFKGGALRVCPPPLDPPLVREIYFSSVSSIFLLDF